MRVLRFKRRTHLLVFQISGRKRDVSIRSAVFSAETSNHTLIPALLNLLQRRNSRGPTPPPPGGGPPASYQRVRSASSLRNLYIKPRNALGYCPWWDVIYTVRYTWHHYRYDQSWPKARSYARSAWAGSRRRDHLESRKDRYSRFIYIAIISRACFV